MIKCEFCGNELNDEETSSELNANEKICDDCYVEEHCEHCILCGERLENRATPHLYEKAEYVFISPDANLQDSGFFKVVKRPFFADGMVEYSIFWDALEKVKDAGEVKTESHWEAGFACKACIGIVECPHGDKDCTNIDSGGESPEKGTLKIQMKTEDLIMMLMRHYPLDLRLDIEISPVIGDAERIKRERDEGMRPFK